MTLFAVIAAAVAESLVSFSGVFFVLLHESLAKRIAHRVLGFAIGTLMGATFFEIIPESARAIGFEKTFQYMLGGVIVFFIIEKIFRWHHHHGGHGAEVRPYTALILVGDAIHNFIDGVILAAGFLISVPFGVATTIAVLAHEVPQEIADFAVLIHGGYPTARALRLNFFVSLTTIAGALSGFLAGSFASAWLPHILGVIGGNFLYIALSDLIPEAHETVGAGHLVSQLALMIAGIYLMALIA